MANNPLDYLIQNPDAMRYALFQDAAYKGGGQVQRFDEGGQVNYPNSPVIEATPQSPVQGAIGTLGGYLDSAGRFISKALEPISQSHPGRTFLANMLLADRLKNAGTALQDYTKTGREITEDQPYVRSPITGSGQTLRLDPRVFDIAGVAQPVVSGALKVAGAGAKAAAPFARSTAEMANELYASGQMRGMVSPNFYMAEPKPEIPTNIRAQLEEFKRKATHNEQLRHEYLKQYHQAELADIPPYEEWLKQTGKQKMAEGVTPKTLSKAEREANLARYTEESSVKEPLYHGTVFIDESGQPFRVPNTSTGTEKLGFHVGTPEQASYRVLLTPDPDVYQPNAHLMPLYVNSKNPLRVTDDEANDASQLVKKLLVENKITPAQYKDFKAKSAHDDEPEKHAVKLIKSLGHDSLVYSNIAEGAGDSYVLFNPHQVKSATSNVGTYDIKNPDMGHARGGSVKKSFTSPQYSGYNIDHMRHELLRQG